MPTLIAVLAVANSLRSDDGENVEYDRALVELTASLMPGDLDEVRELVEYIVLEKRPPVQTTIAGRPPASAEPVAEPVPLTRHAARATG